MKKRDYIFNIFMLVVAIISLIVAIVSLYLTMDASESAKQSKEIANKSLDALINVSKTSEESLNRIILPRPLISYSTNLDYIGNNGNLDLRMIARFTDIKNESNNFIDYWRNNYVADIPPIEQIILTVYNSGNAPLVSPKLYINLTADYMDKTFPFKIFEIVTPLDRYYYNYTDKKMHESFEFSEKRIDYPTMFTECPPYLIDGEVAYPILNNYRTPSEYKAFRQRVSFVEIFQNDNPFLVKDKFGPFRIGTIEPGKKVEIKIKLFGVYEDTLDNYSNQFNLAFEKLRQTEGKSDLLYRTGNLELIIESEKLDSPIQYNYNESINFSLRTVFN